MIFHTDEYRISMTEIDRRRRAFTTLIISFALGVTLSSIDVIVSFPWISTICIAVLAVILILLRMLFMRFFNASSQITIAFTNYGLERHGNKSVETFSFYEIQAIHIKRTIRGSIREIRVKLREGKRVYINALHEFEQFAEALMRQGGKDIAFSESKEPIDYDHPWFYAIFGAFVGLVMTMAVRLLASLSETHTRILDFFVAVYLLVVGAYWLFKRPLAIRYGKTLWVVDAVCGLVIICTSVILLMSQFS